MLLITNLHPIGYSAVNESHNRVIIPSFVRNYLAGVNCRNRIYMNQESEENSRLITSIVLSSGEENSGPGKSMYKPSEFPVGLVSGSSNIKKPVVLNGVLMNEVASRTPMYSSSSYLNQPSNSGIDRKTEFIPSERSVIENQQVSEFDEVDEELNDFEVKMLNRTCHICDHSARRTGRKAVAYLIACTSQRCRKVFCSRISCRKKIGLNTKEEFLTLRGKVLKNQEIFICPHCKSAKSCPARRCILKYSSHHSDETVLENINESCNNNNSFHQIDDVEENSLDTPQYESNLEHIGSDDEQSHSNDGWIRFDHYFG